MSHEVQVILVVFVRAAFQLSGRVFDGANAQITEQDVYFTGDMEYGHRLDAVRSRAMEAIEAELDELLKEDRETLKFTLAPT